MKSGLAGLCCLKCGEKIPADAAALDNVGICPSCDAVLEFCANGGVRLVAPDELTALDIAVRGALVREHLEYVRSQHAAGRLPRTRFKH